MKKYFALLSMNIGHGFRRIMIGTLIASLLDLILFMLLGTGCESFGDAVAGSRLVPVFIVFSIVITSYATLGPMGNSYSYRLLPVPENRAFLVNATSGTLAYLFSVIVQALMLCLLLYIFTLSHGDPGSVALFTDFHTVPILTALFPLSSILRWILVLFRSFAMGVSFASIAFDRLKIMSVCTIILITFSVTIDAYGRNFPLAATMIAAALVFVLLTAGISTLDNGKVPKEQGV